MRVKKKESMENNKRTEEKQTSLHLDNSSRIKLVVYWGGKLE